MPDQNSHNSNLPLGLKITAIYLTIAGLAGLVITIANLGPQFPEFSAKSISYQLGSYSREIIICLIFIVSGVGLLLRRLWARKMALIVIVIATFYTTNSFAWGLAGGKPSTSILFISFLVVGLWNTIWFILIYRKTNVEHLS